MRSLTITVVVYFQCLLSDDAGLRLCSGPPTGVAVSSCLRQGNVDPVWQEMVMHPVYTLKTVTSWPIPRFGNEFLLRNCNQYLTCCR